MKKYIFLILLVIIGITSVSYSYFTYDKVAVEHQKMVAGSIYMSYYDKSNNVVIEDMFTTDDPYEYDYYEFKLVGYNESNSDIDIVVSLSYGEELGDRTRFRDSDIKVFLTEVIDDKEQVLVDKSFTSLNNMAIYTTKFNKRTLNEETRTYRLRLYMPESIIVSDTNPNSDYDTETFANSYFSVKINVEGVSIN